MQAFRELLQETFVERCRKNPKYSLRAYARSLGIEASPLSSILRGKRPLTAKMCERLGIALGMSLDKIQNFQNKHDGRHNESSSQHEFQQITLDTYAIISDWYHYAILELIKTKGFKPKIARIAKTLGISPTETQIAVDRLKRVGFLEIDKRGRWHDTTADGLATNISDNLTSGASKKLQKQILEMSIRALEELPFDVRNHTSITMAAHPEDLPQAIAKIKKFRRDLCHFLEKNKNPTQVYNLAISLYPVTREEN